MKIYRQQLAEQARARLMSVQPIEISFPVRPDPNAWVERWIDFKFTEAARFTIPPIRLMTVHV